jgi:hypothetical protein
MSARGNREDARRRLEERYRRLADARKKRPAAAVAARFTEIDGATQAALVSIQLFTTVIPLIIIGFDYFSGFAENASPGTLFIREGGLVYPLTERVRAAFGDSSAFRSSWTFIGVAGFLVCCDVTEVNVTGGTLDPRYRFAHGQATERSKHFDRGMIGREIGGHRSPSPWMPPGADKRPNEISWGPNYDMLLICVGDPVKVWILSFLVVRPRSRLRVWGRWTGVGVEVERPQRSEDERP